MKEFLEVFDNPEICESYKLIEEFYVYIGSQKIGIKIKESNDGSYHHSCSHRYQGSGQSGPYITSSCCALSKKEAYINAHKELLNYYNERDPNKRWIENNCY